MARRAATAAKVILFWIVAALLVASARGTELKLAAVVITAFAYMRMTSEATVDHALFVGTAWLALAIAAEMVATEVRGSGSFVLCGSPTTPILRAVMFFGWVGGPALFARQSSA